MSGDSVQLRGRNDEIRRLDLLCDGVQAGQSAVLVIRGEAGVGKTALLEHVARRALPHFRVTRITGVESEVELAYAGLHQLCAPMLGRLEALPEPQQSALRVAFGLAAGAAPDRFLVGLATLGLLAEVAGNRPLVCLVDDVQWLDEASGEILGFVARRLAAESVAMVFAVRDDGDRADLRRLAGLPVMPLKGISGEDARALLATVVPGRLDPRVSDRAVAETGGNPLAMLELPRGMSQAELAAGFGLPAAGGTAAGVESHYVRRVQGLPAPTQQLMLLAACDGAGDAATLWRAAAHLGIGFDAARPEVTDGLFEIGAQVRFRHSLVRSAVYRSASAPQRRAAHQALAQAIDAAADPDRRAWHRAHASSGPDEEIALELARSADRARARGGYAAAAALLERSAGLTLEPVARFERRLAAARSHLRAGAFDIALALLAAAESETPDELAGARVALLRGQVASASDAGGDAPLQLVRAARRLERLDTALSRRTYADAWNSAMFAGHLAEPGGGLLEVSRTARAGPQPDVPLRPFGRILEGLLVLATDGRVAAEPMLREALDSLLVTDLPPENWLHHVALAATAAAAVWDLDSWSAVTERQARLARESGALAVLPTALSGMAAVATWRGDFEAAARLTAEHEAVTEATGTRIAPYGAMLLAGYRGRTEDALAFLTATTEDSISRGEGLGVDHARWCTAILHNGAGHYPEAMAAAHPAHPAAPPLLVSAWMLPERIEAAVRCGERDVAAAALEEFESTANPGTQGWGRGIAARSRALLSHGDVADGLYRESAGHLRRAGVRLELARTHLVYGEWLRRESRRGECREHLRTAHDMFTAMSADGFAERARRELLATGEHVRRKQVASRAELTPQEEHIARLARDGRTNPEIAGELFISARTVEWHLRKVFTKLGITSRRGLRDALPTRSPAVPAGEGLA
ncbi:putative LuxR-family transcriptional regulator [Actinoplanes missouriensis 431]|uniref:Putative LuxR-family transcriptional regulator n=1 Tax=Actinoplanes missouriensis (strain ATCC 14538 / DSM 43046 / CBS 188.64 / JCM 3121 / NBRC 102363 / NCIMB 12654 / NRRL B-3342 / UNCC 431) TaxID=512565 RepID=I0HA06_ACTM4|nr:LuxR family transcriptional regulator [Actinoplanes missouriensis]BAL89843.1 putative LuxR-family transcriptional regulator [Actinoplanes missouriensis 431]